MNNRSLRGIRESSETVDAIARAEERAENIRDYRPFRMFVNWHGGQQYRDIKTGRFMGIGNYEKHK